MNNAVKAADIPDAAILALLTEEDQCTWDLAAYFPFPQKVVHAKLRRMGRRGLIHGCACGCRGDWHLPSADERRGYC